ncbi:ABC transporter permease subunit [Bacillus paralicheniformis]|jgi:peptide/nickel transport system permease protein|uniref:ABC transporter permease subunit n=2 Tax=Bacillus TaxID=1386 RepID=A0A6I7TVS1_9BACI|nr:MULTISPECIES: nickel transporter permease [Bacillus]ETB71958.1 nickel ABC transporter permease [Bacillus sp. CPSM8]KJD53357.1 nickel transporter permease NikC [Bacillus amyloliquefaciens]KUL06737.1 nickel ABC transporter permease [Bacillus licheniformis LMG 7559]KUL16858.1 nickel ABC transporter permease [Bacillus licheniformis LMG 6934]MBC8623147.1 ABC transporter permease subunit [Robertmurraya crescens]
MRKNVKLIFRTKTGLWFVLLFSAALFTVPFFLPFDPLRTDMANRLQPISLQHWLGTDHLGRDIFSRMIAGAKATVGTALAAILISVFIGVPVGLVSGFFGGRLDRMIMRIVDAVMAFPDYIVAIVLSGLLGPGLMNLILAVVAVKWVGYARLVRSTVFSEKQKDYIALAELTGLGSGAILKKHLLPHVLGNVSVLATLDIGKTVLMIAALSYIGLGAQPPYPEWGAMLNDGKHYFLHAPQLMVIPGLAIMFIVLLSNLYGDRLRDRFDVKHKKGVS